jgi:hypothetical protein
MITFGRLRASLKDLPKRAGELLDFSRNQLRIMTGLLTWHCHLERHLNWGW